MIFSSVFFMFVFLPIVLLVYFLVPKALKNAVIFLFSLVFYAWGEPVYIVLMLFSILYNYVAGIEIAYHRKWKDKRWVNITFWMAVAVNLGVLGFFKYYGFLLQNLNAILPFDIPFRELPLPIGISFYTFQTLSYIIDVYRDKVKVQRNLISFGAYISMFPQLIAGPIVRYADVEEQLQNRRVSMLKFGDGVTWFLCGLGKKVLLANNIGMAYDAIAALPADRLSAATAWIGCAAYTFQIYFDFSGYSDMAIGLGKMFGFDFMRNFQYPYTSESITDFWRKWHISLSSWFREYVYIPLGGNRVSKGKHIRNILVVWLLTGLWHGAAWKFVVWGLYYGLLLLFEKYVLKDLLHRVPGFLRRIYTMFFVMVGWVIFALPDLGTGLRYLGAMFGFGAGFWDATAAYFLSSYLILFIILILCSGPYPYKKFCSFCYSARKKRWGFALVFYLLIFVLSTAYLVNATYNPFLYFRF